MQTVTTYADGIEIKKQADSSQRDKQTIDRIEELKKRLPGHDEDFLAFLASFAFGNDTKRENAAQNKNG